MSQMIVRHTENEYAECEIRKVSEAEYAKLIEHFVLLKQKVKKIEDQNNGDLRRNTGPMGVQPRHAQLERERQQRRLGGSEHGETQKEDTKTAT